MRRLDRRLVFRFVDYCCIGYLLLVASLLVVFGRETDRWLMRASTYGALAAAIMAVLALNSIHPTSRILAWARVLYPVGVIAFAWNGLDVIVPIVFGGYWATDWIMRADQIIFGMHPTLWVQDLYGGPLDEVMNVFYAGYYFFMPVICITFLLRGRRNELFVIVSLITFTYLVNDLLYCLIPALGPRMVPEITGSMGRDYEGYLFGALTRQAQSSGGIRGACFPSSHVAGAIAWCLAVWRYDRRLAKGLIAIAAGVPIASVYLGYHHAVDAIAGIAVGFGGHGIALAVIRRSMARMPLSFVPAATGVPGRVASRGGSGFPPGGCSHSG